MMVVKKELKHGGIIKMKNKVEKNKTFEYEEEVEDFTGLIFHCPKCNEEFHLHIATVDIKKYPKSKYGRTYK